MGQVRGQDITASEITLSSLPIIVCKPCAAVTETGKWYTRLSLNSALARRLTNIPERERGSRILQEIYSIVKNDGKVILEDYEMLFDPRYKIDALKVFCELARTNKIIVTWVGKYNGDKLVYAEPNFADYHVYDINKYEILCVK